MRSYRFEPLVRCWVNWTLPQKEVALWASVRRSCAGQRYFTAVCLCWLLYAEHPVFQAAGGLFIPTSKSSSQLETLRQDFWSPSVVYTQSILKNLLFLPFLFYLTSLYIFIHLFLYFLFERLWRGSNFVCKLFVEILKYCPWVKHQSKHQKHVITFIKYGDICFIAELF